MKTDLLNSVDTQVMLDEIDEEKRQELIKRLNWRQFVTDYALIYYGYELRKNHTNGDKDDDDYLIDALFRGLEEGIIECINTE